jgi:hypothetical protein
MAWCPKHLWEFTWEGTKVCPACGSELVAERPSAPVGSEDAAPEEFVPPDDVVTGAARLGSFDRLAAPVLLDLLAERGIRAFEAPPLANPATRAWNAMSVDVWVESSGLEEAASIAERDLPEILAAAQAAATEPISEEEAAIEDEEDDEAFITWAPFGWMEFAPARVFLEICDEEGITARTEFPLDKPIPQWADSYGRVQVEVEDIHVDAAEALLESVEERLTDRGVAWTEPLCDLSGP